MTADKTLDVSGLPDYSISTQAPLWWGQLWLAAIEGTMFAIMIAIYFYLRLSVDVWPPPGTQLPHVTLETVAWAPLLLSAVAAKYSSDAAKRNSRRAMAGWMTANVLLASVFLACRAVTWHSFNFTWQTDAHGSVVWAILFLHTFDMVADILYTCVLIAIVARGKYQDKLRVGVHVDTVVWYFLVAIWAPLYFVIYWGPRVAGAP